MKTISFSGFRRNCFSFLKMANEAHETIQIIYLGKPLASIKHPGLSAEERERRDARDIAVLNRFADELNTDALAGLEDQADVDLDARVRTARRKKDRRRGRTSRSDD